MPAEISLVDPLVSILIPCLGQLEYTKLCVPSVLKWSRRPIELIFLDIGSLDGTAEYLAGLQAGAPVKVSIVRTDTDLGIKETVHAALAKAKGDFLVLLNNDTIVTQSWLELLISLVTKSPANGMTGPMSNRAYPPQLLETVPYRCGTRAPHGAAGATVDVDAVHQFAKQYREENRGKYQHVEALGGFCLLIKREVWKKVEVDMQKWTDLQLFDSNILSAKVAHAGYSLALCRDLFIHHFGTREFAHGAKREAKAGQPAQDNSQG